MQNDSIDNIRLDINHEKVTAAIYCRYGDTKTRTIHCTLADNGTVVDLSNAVLVEILIKRTDGHETDNGCVVNGNEIQYTLRTNDIGALGDNRAQFVVTYDDGSMITSPEFSIFVYSKVLDPSVIESTNEYKAAEELLAKTNDFYTQTENLYAEINTKGEEIEETIDQGKETLDDIVEQGETILSEVQIVETAVKEVQTDVETSKTAAETAATNSADSATSAKTYMESAQAAQTAAETARDSASDYADASETSKQAAQTAQNDAETARDSAQSYTNTAKTYTDTTKGYMDSTKEYMDNTSLMNKMSESYAVGDTDYRQQEATDNAKYYYQQAKDIAQSFSGAMMFKQTLAFDDIPELSAVEAGWQYNITDEFTTDDRFIEGSGILKGAGTDIVRIADADGNPKWNCLSGVTVHGVKGSAEQTYRQGNVEITPANLGLEDSITLDDVKTFVLDALYPVGSIYLETTNTNPSIKLGGTWEAYGSSDTYLRLGNSGSGGQNSVSYTPSGSNSGGSVSSHTLTTDEIPSHSHGLNGHTHSVPNHTHGLNGHTHYIPSLSGWTDSQGSHSHNIYGGIRGSVGTLYYAGCVAGGGSDNNSGYLCVNNSWGGDALYTTDSVGHSHSVGTYATYTGGNDGSTTNSGSCTTSENWGSTTSTGSSWGHDHGFTNPTFSGNQTTITTEPKYVGVYAWKRIA